MSYTVIAITEHDGPVELGRYETEREQRRAYRDALACWEDGGFADVTAIELHTTGPGPANPDGSDSETMTQERLL